MSAIKLLILAANPVETARLSLDEEVEAITRTLDRTPLGDRFEVAQHWAVRAEDLQEHLLRHQPDIVHFSGHGNESSEIVLTGAGGTAHPVSPQALGGLFRLLGENIRCVVLNACYTERQARAIAKHIGAVVGMSSEISDPAAVLFATSFYRALGHGRSVKDAFDLGCQELEMLLPGEHRTPRLRAERVDPALITFGAHPLLHPAQPDRLFPLIAELQRTYVRESFGVLEGENFSDDDLAAFRADAVPRAVADSLRRDAAFLAIVLGLQSLDAVERQQLLQCARRPLRRTWREIGHITPEGQTEAGNEAERLLAAAVAGLAEELSALPPDGIRALAVP